MPLVTLPAGPPPTYIKRLCFWLERALDSYVSPPFSMLNPAAGGKIPVSVVDEFAGGVSPSGLFHIGNALSPDLMCAVAVHELMHMVQLEYGGTGLWQYSVFEGGAVFAEDSAADVLVDVINFRDARCQNPLDGDLLVRADRAVSRAKTAYWAGLHAASSQSPQCKWCSTPVAAWGDVCERCRSNMAEATGSGGEGAG